MTALLALALTLLAFCALVVVLTREPARQAIVLGVFGLLEALMFFIVQAPDVAFSQVVVSALALPAMLFLGLAKISAQSVAKEQEREEER